MPNTSTPQMLSTYGVGSQFVKSALMALGATQEDANGRLFLDGSMVNVELSQTIIEAIYIADIFRDGQSVTARYANGVPEAGAIRVLLETPFDMTSRTLGYGGRSGTTGNAGTINTNPDVVPTNEEIMIYLNQLNDQDILFPDLSHTHLPIDIVASKLAGYAASVAQDRNASILAEILAYNIFRAMNAGDNIVNPSNANLSATSPTGWRDENSYAELINELNSRMDNGDTISGAYTYPTEGRTIIGRPGFINGAMNRKSGIIMLGGDLSQQMLREYTFDLNISDRSFVGNSYKGHALNFHWQSAADYIWSLAERYLGLAAGALDNVQAVAVSHQANAVATGVDLGLKSIDSPKPRGIKYQPLNRWGAESFRKSYLIGDNTFDTTALTTLGFTSTTRLYPIAPAVTASRDLMLMPVVSSDGTPSGTYTVIAGGIRPNGGNWNGVGGTVDTGTGNGGSGGGTDPIV